MAQYGVRSIYNGRGQFIGTVNQMTDDGGFATAKDGTRLGSMSMNKTFDARNQPYGDGNLLESLVHSYAAQKGW